jgi:hypothetical protein
MKAVVPLLAVLLASAFGQADPTAVQGIPRADAGSVQCGPDLVTWNNQVSFTAGISGSATLRATTPEGAVLLDMHTPLTPGARLTPLWCGDLLGDGSQELGLETFSGGAHCCFGVSVLALGPGARHLLDVDLGNGGLGQPRQLTDDGPLQLVGSSDVFAYFNDLSFAASPFMPLIFAYDGAQYVEATRQFPDLLSAEIDSADAALADAVARPASDNTPPQLVFQEQQSIALRLYGLHLLLGDADTALPQLESRLSPPAAAWLASNATAAAEAIASVYGFQ